MRTVWDPGQPWATTDDPESMRRWCDYIDEDGMEVDRLIAAGRSPCSYPVSREQRIVCGERYREAVQRSARFGAPVHTVQFRRRHPYHTPVGQAGCGDTTMNLWHVAYVAEGPRFMFLEDEPIRDREYPCLVKWCAGQNSGHVSVEMGVRFVPDAELPQVWIDGADVAGQIEFAVSAKPLINSKGQDIPFNHVTHFFRDLRHLFSLPKLTPTTVIGAPVILFGQPVTADLWFGEKQLLDDVNLQRAACKGPVLLDRLYGGLSITREYLRNALLAAGYSESDNWVELRPTQFRIDQTGTGVEIFFREAKYPWNIIAVGKYDNDAGERGGQQVLLSLGCGGRSGDGYFTLAAARDLLRSKAAENHIFLGGALLLDEGGDVFQKVVNDSGNLVPVPLAPVPARFACQRRLVRCCLFFARG
jgi:hypothetical protein